jgi:CubicO group peptidase (beta-lactamase class C family)
VDDTNYPDMQWQTPVSKLLPSEFVLPTQSLTDQVTLEDILSHRTGISTHDESYLGMTAAHPDDARSLTLNLRNLAFTAPLRTKLQYSNIMFTVATHVVESQSGEDYTSFLHSRIWEPLGMHNTFQDRPDVALSSAHSAQGHRWDEDAERYVPVPVLASPEGRGAGCVLTSAGDYAKFVRCLIKKAAPLSAASHKALVEPRTIDPADPDDVLPGYSDVSLYGLGLYRDTYRGTTLITHDGAVPGFKAAMAILPGKEWGVVICTNSNSGRYVNSILEHMLMDEVLGVREEDRVDWEKLFRERRAKYVEADKKEKEKPEYNVPEDPEPLGVAVEGLVGRYFNKGYKEIRLEMREGKVVADCSDRCFPFVITFGHLSGKRFVAGVHDVWDDYHFKRKAEVKVDGEGKVIAVGIGFEDEMEDLIWFDRIDG